MATKKATAPALPSTLVPCIPEGLHTDVTLYRLWGRNGRQVMFAKIGGKVYSTFYRDLDLAKKNGTPNDEIRRAYCRLAGIKFKDLQTAIKIQRAKEQQEEASDNMRRLRRQAANYGYRLVKD